MSGTTQGISAFLGAAENGLAGAFSRKVLLVDDDADMLALVSRILCNGGYDVTTSTNGQEAIDLVRRDPPDFIITDWNMPVLDGIRLCELVRLERLPHYIYVILLTGHAQTKHMVQAIAAGADDFFSKPVAPGELLSRMQAGQRILELERRLTNLARSDQLTGLLNRHTFFEILKDKWSAASAGDAPVACVMIDVDRFKSVNDRYGHLVGDAVLRSIARVVKHSCREDDHACRYGGEEFCVLLLGSDERRAERWAERCRSSIADTPLAARGETISATASFGVAEKSPSTTAPEDLLDAADQALLVAKRSGRNLVRAHSTLGSGPPP
jgi:diguanylate cyclase (GGDEF)-like protein